jgi:hypothetical protein
MHLVELLKPRTQAPCKRVERAHYGEKTEGLPNIIGIFRSGLRRAFDNLFHQGGAKESEERHRPASKRKIGCHPPAKLLVIMRYYGPGKSVYEKTSRMPDIESLGTCSLN